MTRLLTRIGGALLLSLPLLAGAADEVGEDYPVTLTPNSFGSQPVISRLYSQNLLFFVPEGFVQVRSHEEAGQYVREYAPGKSGGKGWKQMITITASSDMAGLPGVTPRGVLALLAEQLKKKCPTTFAARDLGETDVSGFPAQVAAVGCGAEGKNPPPFSEQTLLFVIQGQHDFYTVQWMERSKPRKKAPVFDMKLLEKRASQLMPLRLCSSDSNQDPPFADCLRAPEPPLPATQEQP